MAKLLLPDWSSTFVQAIEADVGRLISQQLWPIERARFDGWYGQFNSREERFFAAALLNRISLRTKKQFSAAMLTLYRGLASQLLYPEEDDLHLVRQLRGRSDPKLRLVPVLRKSDPPTKSGVLVLRRLQRLLQIRSSWLVWPWQARDLLEGGSIDRVVFVDDFLGSGSQFKNFFAEWGFSKLINARNMLYAPVTAHSQGIQALSNAHKDLQVAASEILDGDCGFFSDSAWLSMCRGDLSSADAKAWYLDFADARRIIPKDVGPLGVGDLALTYGFEHATPNNSLPALWYSGTDWGPLLER